MCKYLRTTGQNNEQRDFIVFDFLEYRHLYICSSSISVFFNADGRQLHIERIKIRYHFYRRRLIVLRPEVLVKEVLVLHMTEFEFCMFFPEIYWKVIVLLKVVVCFPFASGLICQ